MYPLDLGAKHPTTHYRQRAIAAGRLFGLISIKAENYLRN